MIHYPEHEGRTINNTYLAGKLRLLRQEIARKRRGKLTRSVLFLQDNAPAHKSPHPFSPDMAPPDFYLFPKLKSHLRGTQYGSNEGLIEVVNEYLWDQERPSISKGQSWAKCIALKRDYIEK